jgi:hypothetical protein
MPVIQKHDSRFDWCHLCGARSAATADVWFPVRPETASKELHRQGYGSPPGCTRYIRICAACADLIAAAARS